MVQPDAKVDSGQGENPFFLDTNTFSRSINLHRLGAGHTVRRLAGQELQNKKMAASTAVLGAGIEEAEDTRMQFTHRSSNCFEPGLLVCQIPSNSDASPQITKDVTSSGRSLRINRVNHKFIQNAKTSRSIKSGGAGGFLLVHPPAASTRATQQPTSESKTRPNIKLS